jgi:chloride channel 7
VTGNFENVTNAGLIKFGFIQKNNYNLPDVLVFILIGVLGGLLGAAFVEINMALARLRKKYLKKPLHKFFEALAFAFVGSTLVFYIPTMFTCIPEPEGIDIGVKYTC